MWGANSVLYLRTTATSSQVTIRFNYTENGGNQQWAGDGTTKGSWSTPKQGWLCFTTNNNVIITNSLQIEVGSYNWMQRVNDINGACYFDLDNRESLTESDYTNDSGAPAPEPEPEGDPAIDGCDGCYKITEE